MAKLELNQSKVYRLKGDVKSNFGAKIYGNQGEEVKLISCSDGRMAIVESMTGNRYSCRMDDLTTEEVEIKTEAVQADTTAQNKTINRVQVSRNTKAAPINQQTLF